MKIPWTVSVEREDAEIIDRMCEIMGISRSKLIQSAIRGYVIAAKTSGILKKHKAGPWDLIKYMQAGVKLDI